MSDSNGWKTFKFEPVEDVKTESEIEDNENDRIPVGYRALKDIAGVFISDDEIVVTGEPDDDDENHNCDEMGCSSVSPVIFRSYLRKE
ncbi:MAG: hypothetical protein LLG05_18795 [Porphyromonadaceae bacterium]|nr:hypothetical protein [Porphyromonadaceae bacterium]